MYMASGISAEESVSLSESVRQDLNITELAALNRLMDVRHKAMNKIYTTREFYNSGSKNLIGNQICNSN